MNWMSNLEMMASAENLIPVLERIIPRLLFERAEPAIAAMTRQAEAGCAEMQFALGRCYDGGYGVQRDVDVSRMWMKRAAAQGHATATGFLHERERDFAGAAEWYKRGAKDGNAFAWMRLGHHYSCESRGEKDLTKAIDCFRKSAELGCASAMFWLGFCHEYGEGVEADHVKAMDWYRRGAEACDVSCMSKLGMDDLQSREPEKWIMAVRWFRKGADAGNRRSMYGLGLCYRDGKGVAADVEEARKWFLQAAEQDYGKAKIALKELTAL
jgi:uncharacterized protein